MKEGFFLSDRDRGTVTEALRMATDFLSDTWEDQYATEEDHAWAAGLSRKFQRVLNKLKPQHERN